MVENERDSRPASRNTPSGGDLYTWSGDNDCATRGKAGGANNGADNYQYDGSGKRQPSAGSDQQEQPANDHVPANWHPDLSLSSASAKEWFKESQQLRKQKLDLDENGDHTVQHGDSLWTIAQRELHDHGKQGSNAEIRQEIDRIAKLNENLHPSLNPQKDFIGTGWKLHIEPREAKEAPPPPAQPQPQPDTGDKQCVPKPKCHDEVTPPGYKAKPSVIVNNVYTDNAYFDQRGNASGPPSFQGQERAIPNRGDDVYRYSGDRSPVTNNGDLYQYGGDQRGQQQQQQVNRGDLYAYGGDQRMQAPPQGRYDGGDNYGGSRIVNNVYAENAYFDQRGGGFQTPPDCRIMHREPVQSGEDNYYNCPRGRRRHGGAVIQMNDGGNGEYSYSYDQQQPPQYQNGDGRAQYYTYNGNVDPGRNRGLDYYSRARSQQGFNVNDNYSTYRNPTPRDGDDQYAY
ncbi:MAG TPA: LysM domain-containing protein [Drouetiella sp.]